MKTLIFFRPRTEDEAVLRDFLHEMAKRGESDVILTDVYTRDGSAQAALYDVVNYPTIVAIAPDGQIVADWRGVVPIISEISYYLHAA